MSHCTSRAAHPTRGMGEVSHMYQAPERLEVTAVVRKILTRWLIKGQGIWHVVRSRTTFIHFKLLMGSTVQCRLMGNRKEAPSRTPTLIKVGLGFHGPTASGLDEYLSQNQSAVKLPSIAILHGCNDLLFRFQWKSVKSSAAGDTMWDRKQLQ